MRILGVFICAMAVGFALSAVLMGVAVRLTDWIENRRDLRAVMAARGK